MEPGDTSEPSEVERPPPEPNVRDRLRTIGRFLDRQERLGAELGGEAAVGVVPEHQRLEQVNLIDHGQVVSITWRTIDRVGNRSLTHAELSELSRLAREARDHGGDDDTIGGWEELMRTLGQLAETSGVDPRGVFAYEGRFEVAGTTEGESVELTYTANELHIVSELRRLLRSASEPPPHAAG
jgi:hypothetical protein